MEPIINCHVVVIPYPGRGHINPMLNLCKLIASRRADFLISFIVTQEWLGFLSSDSEPKPPANIRFTTIPNVIPSELVRADDFAGFVEATWTKLEAPVELLLDRLEMAASVILYDTVLGWVVDLGRRRNIPVASHWIMSATTFSLCYDSDPLIQHDHNQVDHSERSREQPKDLEMGMVEAMSCVPKAQCLLLATIYALEAQVIDALKRGLRIPIYSIGPAIPYFDIEENLVSAKSMQNDTECFKWLNIQPKSSVLYISQGSFLSVSSAQLDEIISGVQDSGVRYLWVARGDVSLYKGKIGGNGFIVAWCDQLRVLCHDSIGAFWSHCGWNSCMESAFAGIPMLTFPIGMDQITNSKMIVEDWKMGKMVKRGEGVLIKRHEIAQLVQSFMDLENDEGKEMRKRAQEVKEVSRQAIAKGASAETNIEAFISGISK